MNSPTLISRASSSRNLRYAWFAILALSPLAYFGATAVEQKLPHEQAFASISREHAIENAAAFARTLDVDTRGWATAVTVEGQGTISAVMRKIPHSPLEQLTAPVTIDVAAGSLRAEWIKVSMTPQGRVTGFIMKKPARPENMLEEAAARELALGVLRRILGPNSPITPQKPSFRFVDKLGQEREFLWEATIPGVPQVTAKFHLDVIGSRVISENTSFHLDDAFQKSVSPNKTRNIVSGVIGVVYFTFLGIYAIVRYVKRSIEREISHRRTALVVALFAATGLISLGLNGADLAASINGEPATGGKLVFLLIFALGIPGLLFGVAYGAGEGDLREAYPGKLGSVDAFLSGKIFSANCARSILAGVAFAGWLLLLQNLLMWMIHAAPGLDYNDVVKKSLERSPLASMITDIFPDVTVMTAFGLMLPLTLLRSRIRRKWLVYALLVPIAVLVAAVPTPGWQPLQNRIIFEVTFAASVCVPFFFGDLLAAFSGLVALEFISMLVRKGAESPQWHNIAYTQVLPAGIVFLAVELYCAWRGRVYSEAEVRPLYARHLLQRLELTAEIGAARLAQLRLLPDAPPHIAGLSIAGSCTPAREVGGDFYDYYALDDHRLGVFVAEGGNRELGSAMAIALAKGFLLHTAHLDLNPVEVLRRLRSTLSSVLRGENAQMTVLYAVVDGRTGHLRYARAGSSPRLLINGNALAEEIVSDRTEGLPIRHGAAILAPHDALFFHTDGWAARIVERTRRTPDDFLRRITNQFPDAPAEALHQAVVDAAVKRSRESLLDDVTAVVVRLEQATAREIEEIA